MSREPRLRAAPPTAAEITAAAVVIGYWDTHGKIQYAILQYSSFRCINGPIPALRSRPDSLYVSGTALGCPSLMVYLITASHCDRNQLLPLEILRGGRVLHVMSEGDHDRYYK